MKNHELKAHRAANKQELYGLAEENHGREIPDAEYHTKDFERTGGVSLQARTEAIARHVTDFLKKTDRFAKTIIFCVDQERSDQMRRAINNLNTDPGTDNLVQAVQRLQTRLYAA